MTQNNNQFVHNHAESVIKSNAVPTFEEVYAMPYVQESIRSIIEQNVHQYPILEGHEDDLQQELLIYIWQQLPSFSPNRASLFTFIRRILASGITKARRVYFSESNLALVYATDIYDLERDDDEENRFSAKVKESYACISIQTAHKVVMRHDIQSVLKTLPLKIQKTAELIMTGYGLHEIAKMYGVAYSSFQYTYLRPLREAFKNFL